MTIFHCDACATPCHAQVQSEKTPDTCWLDGRNKDGNSRFWGYTTPEPDDDPAYWKCFCCGSGPCYLWGHARWGRPTICIYGPRKRIGGDMLTRIKASQVPPDFKGKYELIDE